MAFSAASSHLEGAVARKNLSLSRWANLSRSIGFKGRVRPPVRPGVEEVGSLVEGPLVLELKGRAGSNSDLTAEFSGSDKVGGAAKAV